MQKLESDQASIRVYALILAIQIPYFWATVLEEL